MGGKNIYISKTIGRMNYKLYNLRFSLRLSPLLIILITSLFI